MLLYFINKTLLSAFPFTVLYANYNYQIETPVFDQNLIIRGVSVTDAPTIALIEANSIDWIPIGNLDNTDTNVRWWTWQSP